MKQLLLFALTIVPAFGTPACMTGTLQDYINLGSSGCQLGTATFAGFITEPGQTTSTPIAASQVTVTPGGAINMPQLLFGVNQTVSAPNLLESFFRFDASGTELGNSTISLTGSAIGNGAATATEDVCAGASFSGNSPMGCSNAGVGVAFVTSSASSLSDTANFQATSFFDVFVDLTADSGGTDAATLSSATVQIGAVPEPGTTLLALTGLAALALRRIRRF